MSADAEKPAPQAPAGLVYPCEFPLKAIVRPNAETEQRLVELARGQLAEGAMLEVSRRPSSGGKYLSLTLNFVAEDAAHLQRVIDVVCADPGVVLAL